MISIIGAGPIGSYTAYLLAKAGEKVRIFEEHNEIGRPVHCAGIVSKNLFKIIKLEDEFIVNEIKGARIYSPNGNFFEVQGKEAEGFILDRAKFDKYLVELAINHGAELFLKHRFLENDGNKLKFENKNYKSNIIIGADGALSKVATCNDLLNRNFFLGLQARIKLAKNKEFVELYMGDFCKKGYGWVVPEGNGICRVGVFSTEKNICDIFNKFLKRFNKKIIDRQSGLIPIYNPKSRICKGNVYLVGDAAGQVKPTTGGGIIIGMSSAEILADCILSNKNYEKEFKKKLGLNMWMNLKIRNALNRFDDKKYNELIRIFNKSHVKQYMSKRGDMDFPSKFFLGLLLRQPNLLKFIL